MEYHSSIPERKVAVTLVAHGLNLRPEAMLPLVKWLTGKGSDVYLVKLSGHYKDSIAIRDVSSSVWQGEMLDVYTAARKASVEHCVPLYFLGYSMGALLGLSMIGLSMQQAAFNRQVLIAPAIALRRRSYLVRLLFFLGKKLMLPSFTPTGYKVNNSLPLTAYQILFTEVQKLLKSGLKPLHIPTLIFIDKRDELVSFSKLVSRVKRFGLLNCRVVTLFDRVEERKGQYHHLIIDEHSMGKSNWEMVTNEMKRFLFEK